MHSLRLHFPSSLLGTTDSPTDVPVDRCLGLPTRLLLMPGYFVDESVNPKYFASLSGCPANMASSVTSPSVPFALFVSLGSSLSNLPDCAAYYFATPVCENSTRSSPSLLCNRFFASVCPNYQVSSVVTTPVSLARLLRKLLTRLSRLLGISLRSVPIGRLLKFNNHCTCLSLDFFAHWSVLGTWGEIMGKGEL